MGTEKESGDRLRIVLDLEPGAEPITGRIGVSAGPSESFTGVMQLVAALDRARGGETEPAALPPKGERR